MYDKLYSQNIKKYGIDKVKDVIKKTGILLYRGNLNKSKIYTRIIFNTDRKRLL